MNRIIRLALGSDAAAVQGIYAPIVRQTPISFETDPPTVAEMRQRIEKTLARWPWLVCEAGGRVLGYAYASEHRARAAYRWSVDVTVYVEADNRRAGVGRSLYWALLELLQRQGYVNAFAGIALPNPGSVGLHEAMGFRPVGVYRSVGFKLGTWHDVGWWRLALSEPRTSPAEPRAWQELPQEIITQILDGTRTAILNT